MAKISRRELRNFGDEAIHVLKSGEAFLDAESRPDLPRRFVPAAEVVAAFAGAPPIDTDRFRREIDAVLDQKLTPRS